MFFILTNILIILAYSLAFSPFLAPILTTILVRRENKDYKKLPKDKRYAGFWERFFAGIIDSILVLVILGVCFVLLVMAHSPEYNFASYIYHFRSRIASITISPTRGTTTRMGPPTSCGASLH